MGNFLQNLGKTLLSGAMGPVYSAGKVIGDKIKKQPEQPAQPIEIKNPSIKQPVEPSKYSKEDVEVNAFDMAKTAAPQHNFSMEFYDLDRDTYISEEEYGKAEAFAKKTSDLLYTPEPMGTAEANEAVKKLYEAITSDEHKGSLEKAEAFIEALNESKASANVLLILGLAIQGQREGVEFPNAKIANEYVDKWSDDTTGIVGSWLEKALGSNPDGEGEMAYQLVVNWCHEQFKNGNGHFPSDPNVKGVSTPEEALAHMFPNHTYKDGVQNDGSDYFYEGEKVEYEGKEAYKLGNELYDAEGNVIGILKNNEE